MKILAISGIRSEYDILYPVIKELKKSGNKVSIVVSGAHLSDYHSNTWRKIKKDGFRIVDKIDTLLSTDRVVQRSKAVGILTQNLSQTVEREKPDLLLIVGDREESIATAIVGNYMNILVAHIGGGDPVFGNADDPIRFAVSKLAHLHFCMSKQYAKNLINVGEEKFRVFFTGNPSYINIYNEPHISKKDIKKKINITKEQYLVLIKHPLSSQVNKAFSQMLSTLKALETFCKKNNYQVVCLPSNSDPGSFEMKKAIKKYTKSNWLIELETLDRLTFINLIRSCLVLVGNSSMGILEAPFYKIPVVNVGDRQKGRINAGNVEFVKYNKKNIIEALEKACHNEIYRKSIKKLKNPYGGIKAAKEISKIINSLNIKDIKFKIKRKLC